MDNISVYIKKKHPYLLKFYSVGTPTFSLLKISFSKTSYSPLKTFQESSWTTHQFFKKKHPHLHLLERKKILVTKHTIPLTETCYLPCSRGNSRKPVVTLPANRGYPLKKIFISPLKIFCFSHFLQIPSELIRVVPHRF